ncbi:MAG: hypothetical protein ACRCXL_11405 [Dermatophilaceae bacterium]
MARGRVDGLAAAARNAAGQIDEHWGTLAWCAMPWWQGRAAEPIRGEVRARSVAPGVLSDDLQVVGAGLGSVRGSRGRTRGSRP